MQAGQGLLCETKIAVMNLPYVDNWLDKLALKHMKRLYQPLVGLQSILKAVTLDEHLIVRVPINSLWSFLL